MGISIAIVPIFTLWSASFADPLDNLGVNSPEVASRNIMQCGAKAVDVRYGDLDEPGGFSQSPTLIVQGATEQQLPCISGAVGVYDVELPPDLQKGFDAIRLEQYMLAYRNRTEATLSARGLLDKVPKFRAGEMDPVAFSRQLEAICGPTAAGALQSSYGPHVISPEWVSKLRLPTGLDDEDPISCLIAAASTADFELILLGNGSVSQ